MVRDIRMDRGHLRGLPAIEVPTGYTLRAGRQGDESAWVEVLREAFPDEDWSVERIRDEFISRPQFGWEAVVFGCCETEIVACGLAWRDTPDETREGRLHWIATRAEHRRRGLARAICVSIMHYFAREGFERPFLETREHLTDAMRLYQSLGFSPTSRDEEERRIWERVRAGIAGL
jgi:ribosomal protein S18 acetylase RimI-like enzyme